MTNQPETIVHWFRKGLRLHDNPSLIDAVRDLTNRHCFRPIFILDPKIIKWLKVGANRWRFLQQSLIELDENLKKIGSKLFVLRGNPVEVFERIFQEWNVTTLTFESDTEPYSKKRDEEVNNISKKYKIKITEKFSHTLYNPEIIIQKNNGEPPLTYRKFLSLIESLPQPSKPLAAPEKLVNTHPHVRDSYEITNEDCYNLPELHEFGINENLSTCLYPGGENEALKRLEKYMKMKSWVCEFEKPNTSPNSLHPSTTVLSPYLKFGCLSSRLFYYQLKQVTTGLKHSKPPVSLLGQLLWREFYYTVSVAVPNFDRMIGNPICCQIPWEKNNTHLIAWSYGKTGYPFIDAIMRQLRQEGWIHHLARHAVACFLTRGDLWISWEEGLKVFEELLLDADWALNAGNWMWLSASAFFHQYFRVYSPVAFGKKTDKSGTYIQKYVPELKQYPSEYIYEPWTAPLNVQKKANCIIGKDYPERIVIHEIIHKINITKMSVAYKNNKIIKNKTVKHNADSHTIHPLKKKSKLSSHCKKK